MTEDEAISQTSPLRITFVSPDSAMAGVGATQGFRVARAISARNSHTVSFVSLESEDQDSDLDDVTGLNWCSAPFATGSNNRSFAKNVWRLYRLLVRAGPTDLVVARSFQGGVVAELYRLIHGVPYVYDMRGAFILNRTRDRPLLRRLLLHIDNRIVRQSAHVITLTEIHRSVIIQQDLKEAHCISTIPTSSVFPANLGPRKSAWLGEEFASVESTLRSSLVVAYIGSINSDYDVTTSMQLVEAILRRCDQAVFLYLGQQTSEMRQLIPEFEILPDRAIIASVDYRSMDRWLGYVDWGLMVLRHAPDKVGSMPSKFSEFLACGVRPIVHGCNEEVTFWAQRVKSGIVLPSLNARNIATTVAIICEAERPESELAAAFEIGKAYFSLEEVTKSYSQVIDASLLRGAGLNRGRFAKKRRKHG